MASTTESLATRLRQGRVNRRAERQPVRAATWDLLKVALLVPAVTTVLLALAVTVTKFLAGGSFGGIGAQTAAAWLAVNQVPLTIGGVTVGVLPLVPTLAMIAAAAVVTARASREVETLHEVASIAAAALAGPLLWTALALAVVADGAAVSSIGQAAPLPAFGHTLAVQLIGVAIGVGRRCLQPLFDVYEFPVTDRVGARAGLLAFLGLFAGGGVLVAAGIVAEWGRIGLLIGEGHSFDGYLGLTLLSILYLPNVIIGALGISVGATAQAGTATVDALSVAPGTVPPLPILGILPGHSLGGIGALVFVLPVAIGLLVGWYCRSVDLVKHLRAVGVAAAVCAALIVLSCALASGGAGELGRVGVSAPLAGVYAFAWIAVTGAVVAGVGAAAGGLLPSPRRRHVADFDLDELLASEEFADLEIIDDPDADYDMPDDDLDAVDPDFDPDPDPDPDFDGDEELSADDSGGPGRGAAAGHPGDQDDAEVTAELRIAPDRRRDGPGH
ncbi:DUF6350 family protein [Gordonia sp. PP30]|uniref:cell division protein PerM n=1 Tax=Gordonia sp. PP30 TaxID=2935861 RepID=UPI001FFE588A|nr:DUF6350 family protein [Gordonia sp. PP30]UQE75834.1 DUF6350 family protein [Gordonia sp. PP30]